MYYIVMEETVENKVENIDASDEDITKRIKQGEKEAYAILVARYKDKLKRYARKFMANNVDIDDMVQDVFIKAYVNIQSFDTSRSFSPWIYRIAHNEFVNGLKSKITDKIFPVDFDTFFPNLSSSETADKSTESFLNEQILNEHLDNLAPKYREPLILYFYEEMDYKKIAEILAVPVSTVGVRISRAKEKLKELIGAKYQ